MAAGLEANKVVNDGDGEVKVLNWVQQAIDVESTSDNDAQDQTSELETKMLVDGKQDDAKVVKVVGVANEQNSDEPNVLEGNRVIGVGILEPLSNMTEGNKKQYIADVRVINYLLQAIPNDNYNSVDVCKNAKDMWERIKRLMYGSDITSHVRHSRLMDEFDKFAAKEGESLEFVYEDLQHLNQAVIQDGRVDIQTKNVSYDGNGNRNAGRQNKNQAFNARNGNDESNKIVQRVPQTKSNPGKANVQCYNYNEKGHYARDCHKPRVRDAKYFREQMLLAMKDEAESNLKDEENDFMLDNSYGDETLEELTVVVIMMAQIQPVDDNAESEPSYDAMGVSEVNASNKVHEQVNHAKCKTIIHISDDDQIDSNIIFDDPYVENNGGTSEHDSNAHDEYHDIQMLAYNVQREPENQKRLNNKLKKQKELLQKELETFKDRVNTFE
ncbi:retrovirus-related pol polyprotein from transposon TNT 1-94 [Tanacetum coccineum]